jgi:site-specific recombinase XerD
MIALVGDRAALRFIDFFTAHIRNPNTRAAYGVAVRGFFTWLEMRGITELGAIRTHHVSAYVELLTHSYSAPTVKEHLAAIRRLFDWLIVGQVIDQNPAAPVRGPTHIVKKGKTPVLDGDEARKLIDSIDVSTIGGLRDRALIALLIYSFAPLCCTDQRPGAVSPPQRHLREANVLRPAKLEHAVQRGDSNGHLGRLPASGP